MVDVAPLIGPIPGGPELLIILLVLVLLFGAQKIPKLARSTGQALGEFRKGREQINDELEEMQSEPPSSNTGSQSPSVQSSPDPADGDTNSADNASPQYESEAN